MAEKETEMTGADIQEVQAKHIAQLQAERDRFREALNRIAAESGEGLGAWMREMASEALDV